jgi:Mg2+ and Co2+ transporter CorA
MNHDQLNDLASRRTLKNLEDQILILPLMLRSIQGTVKSLKQNFANPSGGFCSQLSPIRDRVVGVSFEELFEEMTLLLSRVDVLEKRVRSISSIMWDSMVHLNSKSTMDMSKVSVEIAQDTKKDSAAMKIITIITVFFLPATVVAVSQPTLKHEQNLLMHMLMTAARLFSPHSLSTYRTMNSTSPSGRGYTLRSRYP